MSPITQETDNAAYNCVKGDSLGTQNVPNYAESSDAQLSLLRKRDRSGIQNVSNYASEAHVPNYAGEDGAGTGPPMQGTPATYMVGVPYLYIGLNQWQHSGTSQIHSRQVTANATVETAVVDAPSLT